MPNAQTKSRPISVSSDTVGVKSAQIWFSRSLTARLCWFASRKRAASRSSWAKALTTRMPGMVSASTLVTSRPDAVDLLEAGAQPLAHHVDHPRDEGQRQQRHEREPRIDRDQDRRGQRDHQHVGREVEQVQRQEDADAIGLRADARHQIAGALAAEVFQGKPQEMLVGGGAQIGADALAHQRQDVGTRPAEPPGQQCGRRAAPRVVARPDRNRSACRARRAPAPCPSAAWSGRAAPGSRRWRRASA